MDRFLCRFVDSGDDDDNVENNGRLTIKARYNYGYGFLVEDEFVFVVV